MALRILIYYIMEKVRVKYGTSEDSSVLVTDKIIDFIDGNNIVIRTGTNFNEIFGDPSPGYYKYVFLSINGNNYTIEENSYHTFACPL